MFAKVNNGVMDYYINVSTIEVLRKYPDVTDTTGITLYTQVQMISGEKHVIKGNWEDLVKQFEKLK